MEEPQPMGDVPRRSVRSPARRAVPARCALTRLVLPLFVLPLLLTSLACGGSEGTTLVTSSDPRLAEIAVRILPDLASRSGMELRDPVRVERRSRAELERYLEFKIDEEFPEGRAELVSEAYALLGLVPSDMDLRGTLKTLYLEQIAGFYDPDSTTVFVLDDQPDEAIESLLVHELVHAIQDQSTDLDAITALGLDNDRRVAALAAIEGHATLVMFEFLMQKQGRGALDGTDVLDFSSSLAPALEAARTASPALAGAPLVLQESVLFPYRGGVMFVEALWKERGGRPLPFGSDLPVENFSTALIHIVASDERETIVGVLVNVRGQCRSRSQFDKNSRLSDGRSHTGNGWQIGRIPVRRGLLVDGMLHDAGHRIVGDQQDRIKSTLPAESFHHPGESLRVHMPIPEQLTAKADHERVLVGQAGG